MHVSSYKTGTHHNLSVGELELNLGKVLNVLGGGVRAWCTVDVKDVTDTTQEDMNVPSEPHTSNTGTPHVQRYTM